MWVGSRRVSEPLSGSISELAHELHTDPYGLRVAIASGEVPARFLGGGRYEVGAAVVVDREGRTPVVEPEPRRPGLVESVIAVVGHVPAVNEWEAGLELQRRRDLLAEGVDWGPSAAKSGTFIRAGWDPGRYIN